MLINVVCKSFVANLVFFLQTDARKMMLSKTYYCLFIVFLQR
jgi:hypothetical protein